ASESGIAVSRGERCNFLQTGRNFPSRLGACQRSVRSSIPEVLPEPKCAFVDFGEVAYPASKEIGDFRSLVYFGVRNGKPGQSATDCECAESTVDGTPERDYGSHSRGKRRGPSCPREFRFSRGRCRSSGSRSSGFDWRLQY